MIVLHRRLVEAGIPIHGVGVNPDGSPRIDFRDEATLAHLEQAALLLAAYSQLDEVKAEAMDTLNRWRGERRRSLGLTLADFQDLVYSGKMMQAQRWLDDNSLPFPFPLEASARGLTHQQMAALIVGQGSAWLSASDQIEAGYITALAAVTAAGSEAEVAMVLAALHWG